MIPKKDQKENKRVLSKISMEKPHYEVVYRIRTAPGDIKWVKEEGTGVFSNSGELIALDGFLVDITKQKTAELELREENLRLKSSIRDRHGGTRGWFGPSVNLSNEWQSSRSPTPTSPAEKTFRQVA